MPNRLSPIRTDAPVATHHMVWAAIASLIIPILALLPVSIWAGPSPALGNVELFVYLGWTIGLVVILPALILAHFANRAGLNGWLATVFAGSCFGFIVGFFADGGGTITLAGAGIGSIYAGCFWSIAHGLAALTERPGGA